MSNKSVRVGKCGVLTRIMASAVGLMLLMVWASPALAIDDGRDIIGPHEYDLPTHFKPLNIFVQYFDFGNTDQSWNAQGNKIRGDSTSNIVGITKYVRIWTPSWAPDIGLGYEALLPEVGIRNHTANSSSGGFGDPLTGPVIWFKPLPNVTIGQDFLVAVPVGDSDVGGGDGWSVNTAFLYNINFDKFNFVGDVGVVQPLSESTSIDATKGVHVFTDNDLSYQVISWLAPFVGMTYDHGASYHDRVNNTRIPGSHEILVSGGVYLTWKGQSLTARYSRGVDGANHVMTNEIGLKYALVW